MKVLFLSNYYPPYHLGGYEEMCQEIAEKMDGKGHIIGVLTCKKEGDKENDCSKISVWRTLTTETKGGILSFFFLRHRQSQQNVAEFEKVIQSFSTDIILVWGMWNFPRSVLQAAQAMGEHKVYYYIMDYWPILDSNWELHWSEPVRRWWYSPLKKAIAKIALHMLSDREKRIQKPLRHAACVSQAVKKMLINSGGISADSKVIYNGIELKPFTDAYLSKVQNLEPELRFVYAGRLLPEKGVHTIIEALGEIHKKGLKAKLTIIGKGPLEYLNELKSLAKKCKVDHLVIFLGNVPHEKMPEQLICHDCLIVPSIWSEPLPLIAQEGMAAGLLVIASRTGGLPEIIFHEETGLLFEPENVKELAAHMELVISNPNIAITLRSRGMRMVIDRFNIDRMVNEIEDFLLNGSDQVI